MKKILTVIVMFFFSIIIVHGKEDLVIDNVDIKNGVISPKYDRYNNYYSVTIDNNIKELDFDILYDEEKYDVEILNNLNLVENKLVYVTIINNESKERNTYIFKMYIEDTETEVANFDNDMATLNVESEDEENRMLAPIVGTICFMLIILVYYIIFLK